MLCLGQGRYVLKESPSEKIRFQLLNNLIVLPVELNGVKLSFLLDTGVSKPILFNIPNSETLEVKDVETTNLQGLGGGTAVPAIKSDSNTLKIGTAVNQNQDIYVVFDETIDFTPRLGVTVHGIIGYDVFKDLVVEVNYGAKFIRFHSPETYNDKACKKCQTLNLSLFNNKPYIQGSVKVEDSDINVKLLIDSGSSDALWLFENELIGLQPGEQLFQDFLGRGLSGSVYGLRSKHQSFSLGEFKFDDVNVAYPDSTTINLAKRHKGRNGSLGAGILKRFNLIFDYQKKSLQLRKNKNFGQPFRYNRSGITLQQNGLRLVKEAVLKKSIDPYQSNQGNTISFETSTKYKFDLKPSFTVVELRPDSPADRAGVQIGDVILNINGKNTDTMKLHDVIKHFREDVGKLIRLKIDRDGKLLEKRFRLEDIFK